LPNFAPLFYIFAVKNVKVYMGSSIKNTSKDPQDNIKYAMSTALIFYATYTLSKAKGSL
jgi:hypothetical protein